MTERIGDFLVGIKAMTPVQVNQVLKAQKAGDKRLFGDIAIDLGFVESNAIKSYVDFLQKRLRTR
jgi:hypothetical protein